MDEDHSRCLRAQLDDVTPRALLVVNRTHPGADALASASTALAAASVALERSGSHAQLAARCLQHAQTLYRVAGDMGGSYSASLPECARTYNTTGGPWQQFMFFNAAWLYKATGIEGLKQTRHDQASQCSSSRTMQ